MDKIKIDSLRGAAQFDPIFQGGRKIEQGAVVVRLLVRSDGLGPRLGLIVPKKKAKRAVDRNAFKRVAREAFLGAMRGASANARSVDAVVQFIGVSPGSMEDLMAFKALVAADVEAALARALQPRISRAGPRP